MKNIYISLFPVIPIPNTLFGHKERIKQGRSTSSGSVTEFSPNLVVVFFHEHFHTLTGKLHMYMYRNLRVTGNF